MFKVSNAGRAAALGALLAASAGVAYAHHGWAWTQQNEITRLEGKLVTVALVNPHATVDIDVAGTVWHVELAPLTRTRAAGFVNGVANPGDDIIAFGNRSTNANDTLMKAVRIIVNGTTYDVYPDRVGNL